MFSGWMENRMLLINVAATLFVDGGWLVYCLLIGCFVVIALLRWLQPRRLALISYRLPMFCALGMPFAVFICGFFLPFVLGSALAELHSYDSGAKQLGSQHHLFIRHNVLNTTVNMCFLKDQTEY